MRQQVNLYQPMFRRQPKVFSVSTMLQVVAIVALGLALIYGYGAWQTSKQRDQLAQLERQRDASRERLAQLEERYPKREKSAVLERELQHLRAERDAKARLIDTLSGRSMGNTTGFSAHVEAFARRQVEGLWLTGLSIDSGGRHLALQGSAQEPELVPRFLQALSEEQVLTGREFRRFLISRPEKRTGSVDFVVRTRTMTKASR